MFRKEGVVELTILLVSISVCRVIQWCDVLFG